MARSSTVRPIHLKHTVDVEVRAVPFTPFEALRSLDLERLRRAPRAVVELGRFESDCCGRTAQAIIRRGRVTEIKVDGCAGSRAVKAAPEVAQLLALARKKLKARHAPDKLPVPVGAFFRIFGDIITIDIPMSWTCMVICITVLGQRMCTTCCTTRGPGGGVSTTCT